MSTSDAIRDLIAAAIVGAFCLWVMWNNRRD